MMAIPTQIIERVAKEGDVAQALALKDDKLKRFRDEVTRIMNDYIPDNDSQAPQALTEMRKALQSLLEN